MIMDLVEFLRARLDEDEAVANAAATVLLYVGETEPDPEWAAVETAEEDFVVQTASEERLARRLYDDTAVHIARHDPARVLREVEAKRRMLDLVNSPGPMELRLLASVYSDHPDYDEAWRPRNTHSRRP